MKLWVKAMLAAGLGVGAAQGASAQVIDAGIAQAEGRWGVEGALGVRLGGLGFAITPSVGLFAHRGDDDRYMEEPDPAGGTQCRDTRDGDLDRDFYCENADFKPFGRVEATFAIPLIAEVGAGVRVSEAQTVPYATVAMPIFPMVKLKGNLGDGYGALGLRVGF